jgi:hypothetical protein
LTKKFAEGVIISAGNNAEVVAVRNVDFESVLKDGMNRRFEI